MHEIKSYKQGYNTQTASMVCSLQWPGELGEGHFHRTFKEEKAEVQRGSRLSLRSYRKTLAELGLEPSSGVV